MDTSSRPIICIIELVENLLSVNEIKRRERCEDVMVTSRGTLSSGEPYLFEYSRCLRILFFIIIGLCLGQIGGKPVSACIGCHDLSDLVRTRPETGDINYERTIDFHPHVNG